MDKNYDGKISIEEFINVFMKANEILVDKIEKSRNYVKDYQKSKQDAI